MRIILAGTSARSRATPLTVDRELLDRERDNMHAAMRWALAAGSDLAVPLAAALWRYWLIRGHRRQGLDWLEQAPRAEPPCSHFGACGGCQLQHMPPAQYGAWKRQQVAAALAQRGLEDIHVEPLVRTDPGSRRRARFAFMRRGATVRLGFRERTGHRVIALDACPVLLPPLVALLPPLVRRCTRMLALVIVFPFSDCGAVP